MTRPLSLERRAGEKRQFANLKWRAERGDTAVCDPDLSVALREYEQRRNQIERPVCGCCRPCNLNA